MSLFDRSALCEHPKFREDSRTWDLIDKHSGQEVQVSHRLCLICKRSYGKELWETKRERSEG